MRRSPVSACAPWSSAPGRVWRTRRRWTSWSRRPTGGRGFATGRAAAASTPTSRIRDMASKPRAIAVTPRPESAGRARSAGPHHGLAGGRLSDACALPRPGPDARLLSRDARDVRPDGDAPAAAGDRRMAGRTRRASAGGRLEGVTEIELSGENVRDSNGPSTSSSIVRTCRPVWRRWLRSRLSRAPALPSAATAAVHRAQSGEP